MLLMDCILNSSCWPAVTRRPRTAYVATSPDIFVTASSPPRWMSDSCSHCGSCSVVTGSVVIVWPHIKCWYSAKRVCYITTVQLISGWNIKNQLLRTVLLTFLTRDISCPEVSLSNENPHLKLKYVLSSSQLRSCRLYGVSFCRRLYPPCGPAA